MRAAACLSTGASSRSVVLEQLLPDVLETRSDLDLQHHLGPGPVPGPGSGQQLEQEKLLLMLGAPPPPQVRAPSGPSEPCWSMDHRSEVQPVLCPFLLCPGAPPVLLQASLTGLS